MATPALGQPPNHAELIIQPNPAHKMNSPRASVCAAFCELAEMPVDLARHAETRIVILAIEKIRIHTVRNNNNRKSVV
jgi:hypothetical protein